MDREQGKRTDLTSDHDGLKSQSDYAQALADNRIPTTSAKRYQALAAVPDAEFEAAMTGGSHYSQFCLERLGQIQPRSSELKLIGENHSELIPIRYKFATDYRAISDYLQLPPGVGSFTTPRTRRDTRLSNVAHGQHLPPSWRAGGRKG